MVDPAWRSWDVAGHRLAGRTRPGPARDARPTAVLVHGLASSRYFLPTVEALRRRRPVVAIDLAGFGRSNRPARPLTTLEHAELLDAWIDAAVPGRAVLVANSYGCQVVAELAARRGAAVAGVVLVGPTVDDAARTWRQQVGRWLRDLPHEPFSLAPVLWRDARDAGAHRLWATFQDALRHPVEDAVTRITAPVLVVRGEHDTIAPPDWCRRLRDAAPRGHIATVRGAGHVVNFSHPEVLARCVDRLLADGPDRAGCVPPE